MLLHPNALVVYGTLLVILKDTSIECSGARLSKRMERDAIEFESSGRAESPENVLGLSTTGDHRFNGAVTDQDIKTVHESLNIPTSGSKGGSGTYPPAGERIGNHRISADDFKLDAKEVFAKRGVPSQVIDNFPWASMSQQKGLRGVLRIDPQGEYQLAFLLSELLNWLKKNSETIDHESKYIQVDKHKNVGDLMQPYMDHLAPLVRKKYSDV
ncbi:hypothetical protein Pst134EA_029017 [Puccinia striiformis f. sp. tritici]|uniref:Uncharacterized protein n=1 Tax=Puccinia striiformis f. sp. tritici PST-78 TaxID=1165861 RepID=A0A0L0VCR5_9BASI|nr:hypothetical protein Pst134EA_029017 [Puccinia striiformis f. sp. tritici]KAH9441066.1 hypothetical protein Pst134EB_029715 [Puccinia striiformis f. sp. tritici]KAH9447032.1 hypothetical protein Pst134EA_029017 [Puccinia striiformis f. sp. tritici]KAI9630147.1 hypothetical protein KEM48_012177 [Puccinia striiformis f. sp. tritici PST-130]KNE97060.1 hypothetical protein PSTG_09633 [Puccinia striiformis f. sp. tritici PST-78]